MRKSIREQQMVNPFTQLLQLEPSEARIIVNEALTELAEEMNADGGHISRARLREPKR